MYGELLRVTGSPVVELNRAVAIGEAEGPAAGLAAIEGLQLDGYLYFHTTRADFLRRLDRRDEARESYLKALGLVHSDAERRFIEQRLAETARPEA